MKKVQKLWNYFWMILDEVFGLNVLSILSLFVNYRDYLLSCIYIYIFFLLNVNDNPFLFIYLFIFLGFSYWIDELVLI